MGGGNMFEIWTWLMSFGFLAMLQQFLPAQFIYRFRRGFRIWLERLSPYIYCDVHEFDNGTPNSLYQDVEVYLNSLRVDGAQHMTLCKPKNAKSMTLALARDQRTYDKFERARVEWTHIVSDRQRPMYAWSPNGDSASDEKRFFVLQLRRSEKGLILDSYMKHIETKATELRRAARDLLLYTNTKGDDYYSRRKKWDSVPFNHPATFDTLGLDGDLTTKVLRDLDKFARNESYYRRVGKAWKRGYLLYGPPGTGKSSMIAAIANKMRYDVYDLELTEVESNSELRKLLLNTANKSVIVIEDIDCSLDLSGQRKKKKKKLKRTEEKGSPPVPEKKKEEHKVTLSGLLNFVDGLWSSCGSERIFIFTTNHHEELDPALLRAGRMDMRILLSYCTFSAFKVLAKNYMQLTEHEMFDNVEKAFEGSFMTPAEVTEMLIRNQDEDPETALENLITALGEHREDPRLKPKEPDSDDEDEEEEKAKNDNKPSGGKDTVTENEPVVTTAESSDSKKTEQPTMEEIEIKSTDEIPTSASGSDEVCSDNSRKQETVQKVEDLKESQDNALKKSDDIQTDGTDFTASTDCIESKK